MPRFQQHVFRLGAWAQALGSRVSATPDLGSAPIMGAALQVGWWLCSASRGPLVLSHLLGAISPAGRKSVPLVSPCLVAVVAVRPIGRAFVPPHPIPSLPTISFCSFLSAWARRKSISPLHRLSSSSQAAVIFTCPCAVACHVASTPSPPLSPSPRHPITLVTTSRRSVPAASYRSVMASASRFSHCPSHRPWAVHCHRSAPRSLAWLLPPRLNVFNVYRPREVSLTSPSPRARSSAKAGRSTLCNA